MRAYYLTFIMIIITVVLVSAFFVCFSCMSSYARVYAIDGEDPESFDREIREGGLSSSDNVFFFFFFFFFFFMPPPFPTGEGIKYYHRLYVPYIRNYRTYE